MILHALSCGAFCLKALHINFSDVFRNMRFQLFGEKSENLVYALKINIASQIKDAQTQIQQCFYFWMSNRTNCYKKLFSCKCEWPDHWGLLSLNTMVLIMIQDVEKTLNQSIKSIYIDEEHNKFHLFNKIVLIYVLECFISIVCAYFYCLKAYQTNTAM